MMIIVLQDVGENHIHFLPQKTRTVKHDVKGFEIQVIIDAGPSVHQVGGKKECNWRKTRSAI